MNNKETNQKFPENILNGAIYENSNSIIRRIVEYLFRKIDLDNESREILKENSKKGGVIYASFHASNIALLILNNVLKKNHYEPPVFALESNPFMLQPFIYVLKRIAKQLVKYIFRNKSKYILDTDHIETLLGERKSIVLSLLSRKFFIKRYTDIKYDSLIYLINLQNKIDFPIYIFPQMIFWNMNPDRTKSIVASKATGDRGLISGWVTILKSRTPAFIKISPPINLKEEIQNSKLNNNQQIATLVRNKLIDIYDHNERTVLGPVIKSKEETMEQVLYHDNVLNEIKRLSREDNVSEKKLRKKAYDYYKEIAADYSIVTIKYFARALDFVFEKMFDGIYYDMDSIRKIREVAKKEKGPMILVPSHRSHMDYLIVSYIFFKNKIVPPHIVAGVNLSFFGIGYLFRHSGAFFIRRSFRGLKLYPIVFKQYLKILLMENYSIEFFIEGGRTRTGKLGFPKIGVLRYLIEAIDEEYNKDLMFVPITVNYERILEENAYQKELQGSEKESESLSAIVKARKFLNKKHGKVYVVFNEAFSLKEIEKKTDKEADLAEVVADTVINKINEITVVTSSSLVATVMLLLSDKGFSRNMLKEKFIILYNYLAYFNVNMSDTLQAGTNFEEIIEEVIGSYLHDHIVEELVIKEKDKKLVVDDLYVLRDDNRVKIRFYKNCIIQYLLPIAFVSLALLKENTNSEIKKDSINSEYAFLKDLFSKEFIYSDNVKDNDNNKCKKAYKFLLDESIITEEGGKVLLNDERIKDVTFYARILLSYLESYLVVLSTLPDLDNKKMEKKDFILNIRKNGIKKYHLGEIYLIESLSTPSYYTAIEKLIDTGILNEIDIIDKTSDIEIIDLEKAINLNNKIKGLLENTI